MEWYGHVWWSIGSVPKRLGGLRSLGWTARPTGEACVFRLGGGRQGTEDDSRGL